MEGHMMTQRSSKLPFNIVSHTKTKQNNGNIHDTMIQNINIESRTEYSDNKNMKKKKLHKYKQMWLFVQVEANAP